MTDTKFKMTTLRTRATGIILNKEELNTDEVYEIITNFEKEVEQLKKEKEDWEVNCLKEVNQNQILWNEIFTMMEQGAEPSNAFKNIMELKKEIRKND